MARFVAFAFFLVVIQPAWSMQQDTIVVSLSVAIERALEISPEVRARQARTDFAAARFGQARASRFLTEFTATSAHAFAPALENPNNVSRSQLYLDPDVRNDWDNLSSFNQIEFEALQPIWTWGQLGGSIRAARAAVNVDRAALSGTETEVASRTAQMYYALILTEALSRLTTEAGDIVERAKKEIDRLIEEGAAEVDYADLFQVQITEQEFLQRVVEVDQKRSLARAALSRQMFLSDNQVVASDTRILSPIEFALESLQTYQTLALQNRHELEQVDAGMTARSALVDVARSEYYPKLFLGISGKWSYAANRARQRNPFVGDPFLNRGVRAGLGFRQNLNLAQIHSKVAQAEAEFAEVRFQGDAARQLVLFEVEEAYRNVIIARTAMNARARALLISKNWLRDEEINFDLEIGDTENLVKAVQTNLMLRAKREEAVHDYNVAVIRLLENTATIVEAVEAGTLVEL